jgi:arsenate reductase
MKILVRSGKIEEEQEDKTVLFVCVENSGRSQMVEAFFLEYAPKGYSAFSAGTKIHVQPYSFTI